MQQHLLLKFLSPSVPHNCSSVEPITLAVTPVSGVSLGKLADIRMKILNNYAVYAKVDGGWERNFVNKRK